MASSNKRDNPGALFIPGGLLTGMGVGFVTNNVPAGMFIGLGVGFILFAMAVILTKKDGDDDGKE